MNISGLICLTSLSLWITTSLSHHSLSVKMCTPPPPPFHCSLYSSPFFPMEITQTHQQEDPKPKENILTITSPLSSPTHEFSFTITLHPSPNNQFKNKKDISSPSSFALDLAPADDIFFHGHLLPLHLLSRQPPLPPCPSTEGLISHPKPDTAKKSSKFLVSLFGLRKWWRTGRARLWKKYASFVEPLFASRRDGGKRDLRRRPYSFSGKASAKESSGHWMRRRGQFSAPVSTRTSPTNSGLLLATPTKVSSSDDSSMEELQNAIKAAIAHCKNSTTAKESDECM